MRTLSDVQRKQWAIDGYLKVEGALGAEQVAFFQSDLDRIRQEPGYEPVKREHLNIGHYEWLPHADDVSPEGFMDRRDLLPYGQPYVDLIDHASVFDLIVDLMGPNILFSMSQAIVRPSTKKFPGYTHTDGGEALRGIRVTETSSPLAVKAMYLLSDVQGVDNGNLTVFPGSHMNPFDADRDPVLNPHAPGAAQLTGKAGDCYLFAHSLWHGPAPNRSGHARKTLLYNYCQLFMRQYDFEKMPTMPNQCTPRQRRLLGDLGYEFRPGSYFYVPLDQDDIIIRP
jgi:hypothetical protein